MRIRSISKRAHALAAQVIIPTAIDLCDYPMCVVGSDALKVAMPIREGFSDEVANAK
jgi:hypothetical protein